MAYTIGVSTGLFKIAAGGKGGGLEYLGLPRKAIWSIYKGVRFSQVDLESISEFLEPDLKNKMKKVKDMGIEFGVHGEAIDYAKILPFLDSALEDVWKRSHQRLLVCLKECGKIGAKYFLLHASNSAPWPDLYRDLTPTILVDVWGRRVGENFLKKENPHLLDWASKASFIGEIIRAHKILKEKEEIYENLIAQWKMQNPGKEPPEDVKKKFEEDAKKRHEEASKELLTNFMTTSDVVYGAERIAFYIIAKWMQEGKNCPSELRAIWKGIVGNGNIDDQAFRERFDKWVPAVTAAYTWGHFNPDKCPTRVPYENPKPVLEKYTMYIVFETPMAGAGTEETSRLGKPVHIYHLVKNMSTSFAAIAIDAEHQLSSNIDPLKQADMLPEGGGKYVQVIHAGYPAVLAPAHIPIPLGSDAQMFLYELIWKFRQKGFKDGFIIFERGGGDEPIQESVLALKKIVEYLEKGIPPDKLSEHEDFFGLKKLGPELIRQRITIKEHATDPLKGMLMVPEEEYGFLGTTAQARQKLEEWKKEKLK